MRHKRALAIVWALAVIPSPAWADADRHELGRRLRQFEQTWEAGSPEGRRRAVEPLKNAVNAFFTFNPPQAAKALDAARFAVEAADPPLQPRRWAESLRLAPARRLLEASDESLLLKLDHYYKPEGGAPEKAALRLVAVLPNGKALPAVELAIDGLPLEYSLRLKDVPTGDWVLRYEVCAAGNKLVTGEHRISRVQDAERRLAAAKKTIDQWKPADDDLERATARHLHDLLRRLAAGDALETDYPAARLLDELEAVVQCVGVGKTYYGKDRPGEFWLSVPHSGGRTPVRVFVPPPPADDAASQMVLALHGMGGSENLFFDAYGAGKIVRLCERRGWLLAAPRIGLGDPPLTDIIDALARRYPMDARQVFLVGHSRGAAQAASAASRNPDRFAAVAALGGGGAVKPSDALKKVAFFVGCGSEDFLLRAARSLADSLNKAEVAAVEWKEYPDVEHLAIVQAALADVFDFFDKRRKK